MARSAVTQGIADAYKAGIKAGLSPRYLGEVGRISTDQRMFKRLPQGQQIAVLQQASDDAPLLAEALYVLEKE